MNNFENAPTEPVIDLIQRAAPHSSQKLKDVFGRLNPEIRIDRRQSRILFSAALGNPNVITIGLECTRRLEAYAYVSSLLATASAFPVDSPKRTRNYRFADELLNWAVRGDLGELSQLADPNHSRAGTLFASDVELPPGFLGNLDLEVRQLGRRFFEVASSFILLHELGHLELAHTRCQGFISKEQEKDADRFAASWIICDDPADVSQRLSALFGISTALLWLTISNVYFGVRESATHPEPYDRLFNVLDQQIERSSEAEFLAVWDLVGQILFIHMHHAGFAFDEAKMQTSPRGRANYLIDLLSNHR